MRAAVILNKHSGNREPADLEDKIQQWLKKYSINPEMFLVDKYNFSSKIDTILENSFDAIIGAGGDGTINSAAVIAVKKNIPLGIIPLGTFNHFAKDLEIPIDPKDAVEIIGEKNIRNVDIGQINDNFFLNNSSVGLYPKVVKKRDEEIEKLGGKKYWAMWRAVLRIFKRFPVIDVEIEAEEKTMHCKTPFVFIGNNSYKMDLFNLGRRERVDEGKLYVYYPNTSGKYSVFKFILSGLFNRLNQEEDFSILKTRSIRLESRKKKLEVSLDGEVLHLQPPLSYKILPKKLKIFARE